MCDSFDPGISTLEVPDTPQTIWRLLVGAYKLYIYIYIAYPVDVESKNFVMFRSCKNDVGLVSASARFRIYSTVCQRSMTPDI